MKKLVISLVVVNIILIISIICLTNYVIQSNKNDQQLIFSTKEWVSELRAHVEELEDKVESLELKIENINKQ